jgi:ABC-2 type transport system permease protein
MAGMSDVISFEVFRTLRKRSFWFTTIAPPIIMIIVFGISYLSSSSAAKNSQQQSQDFAKTSRVAVLDDSGLINKSQLKSLGISLETSRQVGIDAVKAGQIDAFFYYPADVTAKGIEVYAQDKGISLTPPYNTAATELLKQNVIEITGKTLNNSQAVQILQKDPIVSSTTYKNGVQTNELASIIAPGLFVLVFLTILVLLSAIMIAATTEEKENRVAEILLTTIKAQTLILGKILSIFILGLVQIVVIIVPLLIYYLKFKSHVSLPGGVSLSQIPLNPTSILFGFVFCVLGLVMYTGFLVGLGSMFPSAKDASRFLGLAFIWAYVPIYALGVVITSPHALIVTVFTYFPLTAPTTALFRNAVGSISTKEAFGVIAILFASAIIAILFAVRAFRYGAMEYGRRIGIKELFL